VRRLFELSRPPIFMDLAQQVIVVLLVLALLGALVKLARIRGWAQFALPSRSSAPRRMAVLERLNLTPSHSLHLVSVDGQTFLVGVSSSGCQLLEKKDGEKS
jgi:flagellar biogenesis protein FliO